MDPDRNVTDPPSSNHSPACHGDCFGRIACHDGVVTFTGGAPTPCFMGNPTGCPLVKTYTCAKGCEVEGDDLNRGGWYEALTNPAIVCVEGAPKQAGDPCEGDADCLPTPAMRYPDGGALNTYLRCDVASGACVDAPAPVVAEWLEPCDASINALRHSGLNGVRPDATCAEGQCLFFDDDLADCVRQGCTRTCTGDHECPQGATCDKGICTPHARAPEVHALACPT